MKSNLFFNLFLGWIIFSNYIPAVSAGVLSRSLLNLQQEYKQYQAGPKTQAFVSKNKVLQLIRHDHVVVELVSNGDSTTLKNTLRAMGMTHIAQYKKMFSGILSIEKLQALENIPDISIVRASKPMTNMFTSGLDGGSVYNQADAALFTDVVRKRFGIDGSGIKIGVLSDSYNCLAGEGQDVLTGDLPADVTVLQEFPDCATGTDEGRAMMQLIHDIAPGSKLYFHTAFTGRAGFADGIRKLAEQGANIIVDDVGYADELMFQDGIIAQAVDDVKDQGVAYFSSAGNAGRLSYQAPFNAGTEPLSGDQAHNFSTQGGADFYQKITIPEEALFRLSLQWDDPAESAGGIAADTDLDIFLLDADQRRVLATGIANNIGHDPIEFLVFFNDPELQFGTDFNLYISHRAGPQPGYIKYLFFAGIPGPFPIDLPEEPGDTPPAAMSIDEHATNSGTILGHSNAKGGIAVGAIHYQQTPWFNQAVTSARIETFSSAGGTPTFFDINGHRLSEPEMRMKPEIIAPDATNTTFFPSLEDDEADTDQDGLPNFSGTSAAAPHAAALAALVISSDAGRHLDPDALYEVLRQGSLDLDDPFSPEIDNGFDWGTGHGLVQADLVFNAIENSEDGVHLTINNSQKQVKAGEIFHYRFSVVNHSDKRLQNVRIRALKFPDIIVHNIDGCLKIDIPESSCLLPDIAIGQVYSVSLAASVAAKIPEGVLVFETDLLTDTAVDLSNTIVVNETPLLFVAGDLNRDGCVDISDWGILFSVFRSGTADSATYDITDDGQVSLDDLTELERLYSRPGGAGCF